jgi:transposase
MAKKYDNDFKVMIVELLQSGLKANQVGDEYGLNANMIVRWKREYASKSGDFSKKREISMESQELKLLRKELSNVKMERDILKKAVGIFSKSDI